MSNIVSLLDDMWRDYRKMNPQAGAIHDLFEKRGDEVVNDHIALRTFNSKKVGIDHLAKSFLSAGYHEKGDYHFEEKKLYAKHFEHNDKDLPKIFISELLVEEFSKEAQEIIHSLVDQISNEDLESFHFSNIGRPWKVTTDQYTTLSHETEYAAWVAAHGFKANHFTVFVNQLKSFKNLKELNNCLKENGFALNTSGGEIKGSPEVYLEQSSTMAGKIKVSFEDGPLEIPACYYEFAKRYPLESGTLYQGFVAKSADKIFESTNS